MTSSPSSDRVISVGRRLLPWLVGPAALILRGRSIELTGPSACPGLLELASIAAVRLNPGLQIGTLFDLLHTVAVVAALAAFVTLVGRRTRNPAIPAATGLAVGLSPLFGSTLSPPWESAAFGLAAAALLMAGSSSHRSTRSGGVFFLGAAVSLAFALLVPPWLLVAGAGACVIGAWTWPRNNHRWIAGGAAAAALLLIVPVVLNLSRPDVLGGASSGHALMSCLLPRPSATTTLALMSTIGWWFGPFALGLAALGAFVESRRNEWRATASAFAAGLVCLALASGAQLNAQVAVGPLAVVLWCLTGVGLDTLVAAAGRRSVQRVVASLVVLLLLPALEASRRVGEERDDWVRPRGHDTQTLRQTTAMLDLVPQDAVFVEEDATADILLRAAIFGGRRRGKPVIVIAPGSDAVARTLAGRTVYALPWRQEYLSLRGFVVEPVFAASAQLHALSGLAAITGRTRCREVGATWADVSGASGRIAIAADVDATRGPVLIYLGGAASAQPGPDGWTTRTVRGFRFFTFDQRTGTPLPRLQAEARDVGLPLTHPVLAAPFVVRLTLHRTPRAPLALAVTLGAPFPVGVAKFEQGEAAVGHLTVCDAPAVAISSLEQNR